MKQIALKNLNQISHIALDIETIPNRPLNDYEPTIQEYIKRKLAKAQETDPGFTYEKFASLHPSFGRIICLSWGCIAESVNGEQIALLKSYTGDEKDILQELNRQFCNFRNTFVHYNGRSFDVPFILTRMRLLQIACPNPHFADLCQPNGWPHLDLMEYHANGDPTKRLPLVVLAALTGLPSPKHDLDGSTVFEAFQSGEIRRIARYCEWDVATTLNLLRYLIGGYAPVPPERLYSVDVDEEYGHLACARTDGSCPTVWDEVKPVCVSSEEIPQIACGAPTGPWAAHPGNLGAKSPAAVLRLDREITKADLLAASKS